MFIHPFFASHDYGMKGRFSKENVKRYAHWLVEEDPNQAASTLGINSYRKFLW